MRTVALDRNLSRDRGTGLADGRALRLAWSPEGRHLITLNSDNTAYVLRLAPAPGQAQAP